MILLSWEDYKCTVKHCTLFLHHLHHLPTKQTHTHTHTHTRNWIAPAGIYDVCTQNVYIGAKEYAWYQRENKI